ncbi:SRPBCC domain-containing protein [Aquimarina gracilis]|uniref:SRPBCC domain-containing protein n=1 Tax=Aquimarina gracilis TaxID=874422 RepID=A0ABU5ZRC6_9FLAO|nr:SRPBCC domain-containing protein [Aquimarina gracilis]MEB3344468.1 SRPBCC domain-containing protein [Aquimarina gracilis]
MEKLQWSSFTKKIYIHAPIKKIYDLWATTEGITSWFLKSAEYKSAEGLIRKSDEYIQKGDTYIWCWHNWDGKEEGKVLEANGKDYLEITFETSKVSVQLKQKNNVTIVILTQYEIPVNEESKLRVHFGCSNGWTFWLTNLKAFLEHGILLNETEINLQENELAGYEFVNM